MKFLTALKTIASTIVWGLGQLFNRQYLKSLFFFVIFASFITIELATSNYFVHYDDPNDIALNKIPGHQLDDIKYQDQNLNWFQTTFLAAYDAYVANTNLLDPSDDRPIVEFEEYLAENNVFRGSDGRYFSSFIGGGAYSNPSSANFTQDVFIKYFAKDLKEASYGRYTQLTTSQNPTIILDEDWDTENSVQLLTVERLFVDVSQDPSFSSEVPMTEDPSTWVFYREVTTNAGGNIKKEYIQTNPLTRIPSSDNPNTLTETQVTELSEQGYWKTFNKNGKIYRAQGIYYVGVAFNSQSSAANRYLLLSTSQFSLRTAGSGTPVFNPLERPEVIGPLYESNGVIFEKYQAGLNFNSIKLQYKQTEFSLVFRQAMVQTFTITPNLISSPDFTKLMLEIWFELNPEVRDAFYSDYNNFFYDRAGMFVKGYWEVVTLGQAKKVEFNEHLSLVDAMLGRANEDGNSNIRTKLSYDGAIVRMGHVSTQLLLEGLIAVILSFFFIIAGIWNVVDAFKVAEFKRKELRDKGWVIKPVPVSELVIVDILTLGLFRLLWNFFAARAIKQITKISEINPVREALFSLIPFYGAIRLYKLVQIFESYEGRTTKIPKAVLILGLFLVPGIIANCMIQHRINKYLIKAKPAKRIVMTTPTRLGFMTIITLGIYLIVWLYRFMRNIKTITKDDSIVVWKQMLLSIFIPFYGIYYLVVLEKKLYQYRLKEHAGAQPLDYSPVMITTFSLGVLYLGFLAFIMTNPIDVMMIMWGALGVIVALLLSLIVINLIISIRLAQHHKYPFNGIKEILLHLIPFYSIVYYAKIHRLTTDGELTPKMHSKRSSLLYIMLYSTLGFVALSLISSLEFISLNSNNTLSGQSTLIYIALGILGFGYFMGTLCVPQEQLNVEISRFERFKDPILIITPELVDPNAEKNIHIKVESLRGASYFKHIWETGFEYIILFPALFVLAFISIMPIAFGFVIAFTSIQGSQSMIDTFDWVGLNNFIAIFNFDSVLGKSFGVAFWRVLSWTVVWAIFSTFTVFFGGFFQALILNSESIVFRKLWRTILILPWAIPALLSQMVFSVIFNENGLVNQMLQSVGMYDLFTSWGILGIPYNEASDIAKWFWMGEGNIRWFTNSFNPNFVRVTLIVVNIWLGFPYFMALMTGIMTAIDKSLYEAADIDGASGFQKLMKITMPLVLYSTAPILIMTFSGNFNNFGVIYFITGGGPNQNIASLGYAGDTDILISWMYKLTTDYNIYNMASVFSVLIFLFVGSVTAWNLSRTRAFQED